MKILVMLKSCRHDIYYILQLLLSKVHLCLKPPEQKELKEQCSIPDMALEWRCPFVDFKTLQVRLWIQLTIGYKHIILMQTCHILSL